MALPLLKHYMGQPSANNTWTNITGNVPAGRALVISKIVVAADLGTVFYIATKNSATSGERIVSSMPISAGQTYTENGIVIITGEAIWINVTTNFANIHCNVFGEEVDN